MGPIFIPRDLTVEHREIHWKPLLQKKWYYVSGNIESER
jgi:hypothetical protein